MLAIKGRYLRQALHALFRRRDRGGPPCQTCREWQCMFACAPTPGPAEWAQVICPDVSNTLPRVATEGVVKKRVAKWREGDGVHWVLQVEKNLGESATNRAIAK